MGRKKYGAIMHTRAERLRAAGLTYAEIRDELHVPKSTLSLWLGEKYPGIFDRRAHLEKARRLSAARLHKDKEARDRSSAERGRNVVRTLAMDDVGFKKSLLAMLYWAEGGKTGSALKFVNTDPRLATLYITLLRTCFPIREDKLRIRLHLHYYHNKKKSVRYWSRLLRVPITQFGKLYIKKRSTTKKFRQNFMGICFITYCDTNLLNEVLALAYVIHEKIVSPIPSPGIEPGS